MGDERQETQKLDPREFFVADIPAAVLWISSYALTYLAFRKVLGSDELWHWGAILGVVVAVWLGVLIHEVGHAVATLLCGWRVVAFAAGPLGIHVANRDFAIVRRSKRSELAGFVVPAPRSAAVWTKAREAWIDASGSIANFAAGALLIATSLPTAEVLPEMGPQAMEFSVGIFCLVLGIASLLPSRGIPSDGQQLARLWKRDESKWRRERAIGWLYGLVSYQLRLRDLPSWMLEEAFSKENQEEPIERLTDALQISIALDTRPVAVAHTRQLIDNYREHYEANAWLNSCDAYFTAVWEKDAVKARALLWTGEVEREIRALVFAAEASVCAAEGNAEASRVLIKKMDAEIAKRSIFEDWTFRDIGIEIERVISSRPATSS